MTQLSLMLGNVLLSMFVRLGILGDPDWRKGREIHSYVIRFSYDSEIDVFNTLITMYVKCADVCSARVLFDEMSKRDRIS
uniref:Pentatricopeptide repeat-containing protein n=1 Tax=Solanum lycopersicum TaxID=4081 RepID=K4CSX5_SOLLC